MSFSNVQKVRILYKTILRLHRGLPDELSELGTKYTRDEFKRHKKCEKEEAQIFLSEWTNYAITLTKQLDPRGAGKFGVSLNETDLEKFKDDQLYQLYELMEASKGDKVDSTGKNTLTRIINKEKTEGKIKEEVDGDGNKKNKNRDPY